MTEEKSTINALMLVFDGDGGVGKGLIDSAKEHLEAMRIGRERFYTEYGSYVCEPARKSRFKR